MKVAGKFRILYSNISYISAFEFSSDGGEGRARATRVENCSWKNVAKRKQGLTRHKRRRYLIHERASCEV